MTPSETSAKTTEIQRHAPPNRTKSAAEPKFRAETQLRKHATRVAHFHAKNIRANVTARVRTENLSFLQGVLAGAATVPGDQEGAVEFKPLLQILADQGHDGWIVIEAEQDPHIRNPLFYQTLGLHTLKRIAKEVGLI